MPKAISVALKAHLAEEVTTITSLWHITRIDGVEFFFTELDQDLVYPAGGGGDLYLSAAGYNRTAIGNELGYAVTNVDVAGAFDNDAIKETDLRAGLFNGAEVLVSMVNWADLTQGGVIMERGEFGQAELSKQGIFKIELRGLSARLQQVIGKYYQAECRADVGDHECKIPLVPGDAIRSTAYAVGAFVTVQDPGTAGTPSQKWRNRIFRCTTAGTTASMAPAYDYTVGHSTTDGTAVFLAVEAWSRTGVVAAGTQTTEGDHKHFNVTLTEARDADDWFKDGAITFETGDNAGATIEVRAWTQTDGIVTLFLKAPFLPAAGDVFFMWPGCNHDIKTGCRDKFDNVLNFRGEPYVPGQSVLAAYASGGVI